LLVLAWVVVLLALAGPTVAGGMKATFASGVVGVGDAAALRRLMSTRLEDGVAPELTVDLELHRRVLAGGFNKPAVLTASQPACLRSCPAAGQPYTGRGCKAIYHCH
jgi:hypothetical protein